MDVLTPPSDLDIDARKPLTMAEIRAVEAWRRRTTDPPDQQYART